MSQNINFTDPNIGKNRQISDIGKYLHGVGEIVKTQYRRIACPHIHQSRLISPKNSLIPISGGGDMKHSLSTKFPSFLGPQSFISKTYTHFQVDR